MKKLNSKEIRSLWIDFWKNKGHEEVPSKSLIPVNDPSLLWINSGVATLKDFFSGKKIPQNPRLTNSQKSIRTNDIENVGVTARHHTLFEMLGNFSIGEYFKDEALEWAYEFVFGVLEFPKDKVYITYFDEDTKTYDKWISLGIDPEHLIKGNRDTNFWDVGSGPCGPDTELFFDRGEKYDPENVGIKLLKEDLENDRYIEFWNIVFSEFNNDGNGNYEELKQKNIDTGAGLERLNSIMNDAPTNFDTDSFLPLIKRIEEITGSKYVIENYFTREKEQEKINKHFRVIADHIRAVCQAIEDGAKPSNTQRGYIIRRLIRRAYRAGLMLGVKEETFLHTLVKTVAEVLDVYPIQIDKVAAIIKKEEVAFAKTIKQGEELLEKEIQNTKGEFDFAVAFKLFETYGFPIEITEEILEERGIKLDTSKFAEFQERHAEASRGSNVSAMESQIQVIQDITSKKSEFIGYSEMKSESKVVFQGTEGDRVYLLLDKTPLYPTGGGQANDWGTIDSQEVLDVFKDKYGNVWHVLEDEITHDEVTVIVNPKMRLKKERNHSATHLLGFALRKVFGDQVIQLGSDNNENRLRFDFPLEKRPAPEKLLEVENVINSLIDQKIERKYIETNIEHAKELGAIALEGEEYGEEVRVVKFNEAIEFCGGTHIQNTELIEKFKIVKFESKGSGIFRIEAVTGFEAVDKYLESTLNDAKEQLKQAIEKNKKLDSKYSLEIPTGSNLEELTIKVNKLIEKAKEDNKSLRKASQNVSIDTNVEFTEFEGKKAYINLSIDPSQVKPYAINLREAHPDALIIVGAANGEKTTFAVASKEFDAKAIFDGIASKHNGRGGGNSDFAMGSASKFNL